MTNDTPERTGPPLVRNLVMIVPHLDRDARNSYGGMVSQGLGERVYFAGSEGPYVASLRGTGSVVPWSQPVPYTKFRAVGVIFEPVEEWSPDGS